MANNDDVATASNPVNTYSDRAVARKAKLKQLELEQQQWDQEALVMTEDQQQTLLLSFKSVKTEFSDLDGLSWSRYSARRSNWVADDDPTPRAFGAQFESQRRALGRQRSKTLASYAVLSRAELASFSPEETIRPSRSSRSPLLQCSAVNHLFRIPRSPLVPRAEREKNNVLQPNRASAPSFSSCIENHLVAPSDPQSEHRPAQSVTLDIP